MVLFCISYTTETFEMDIEARNAQKVLFFGQQILLQFLFPIDYLTHLVYRHIFIWFCTIMMLVKSKEIGDIYMPIAMVLVIFLMYIITLESILYVNHRAKAKLFLQMKMISMQEQQISNLLDMVPDKVLICSKAKESSAPRALYSNL